MSDIQQENAGPGTRTPKAELEDAHVLVPGALVERLRANDRKPLADSPPVLKIFNPVGAATWLIHSIEEDGDTMFGLCDLGMGFAELGSVSLAELAQLTVNARMTFPGGREIRAPHRMERDLHFHPEHTMQVYWEASRAHQKITEMTEHLEEAARRVPLKNPGRRRRR